MACKIQWWFTRQITEFLNTLTASNGLPDESYTNKLISLDIIKLGKGVTVEKLKENLIKKDYLFKEINEGIIVLKITHILKIMVFAEEFEYIKPNKNEIAEIINLSSITIRNKLSLNCVSYDNLFNDAKVRVVDLNKLDTCGVKSMQSMFEDCQIAKLKVSQLDTSKIVNMSSMFEHSHIESMDISRWKTGNVEDMSYMFYYSHLPNLNSQVQYFDTSKATNMRGMFAYTKEEQLDLNHFNTANVVDTSSMFFGARIYELKINNFVMDNVDNANGMFNHIECSKLDIRKFQFKEDCNAEQGLFVGATLGELYISDVYFSRYTDRFSLFCDAKISTVYDCGLDYAVASGIEDNGCCSDIVEPNIGKYTDKDIVVCKPIVDNNLPCDYENSEAVYIGPELMSAIASNNMIEELTFEALDIDLDTLASRAIMLGHNINRIDNAVIIKYGNNVRVVAKEYRYTPHIGDNGYTMFGLNIKNIKFSNIKLGKSARKMFYDLRCNKLDLSGLDLSEVEDMSHMFSYAQINILEFGENNTSKVMYMQSMFESANIRHMDTSKLDFSKAVNTSAMFRSFRGVLCLGVLGV